MESKVPLLHLNKDNRKIISSFLFPEGIFGNSNNNEELKDLQYRTSSAFFEKISSLRIDKKMNFEVFKTNLHPYDRNFNILQSLVQIIYKDSFIDENKNEYSIRNIKDILKIPLLTSSHCDKLEEGQNTIDTYTYLTTKYGIFYDSNKIKEKTLKELNDKIVPLYPKTNESDFAHLHTEPVAFLDILEKLKC